MTKYGPGAGGAQLRSAIEQVNSSERLPFREIFSSTHLANEVAAVGPDYRERVFSPTNNIARLYGASPLSRPLLPASRAPR